MTALGSKPKVPPVQEQAPPIATVEESAEEAARRRRKRLTDISRRSTIMSGIQSALKKRLGE